MAKRVKDARAAKDARQKKIAIVGAILLVAVLAFQGPKTMKMLKGTEASTAAPAVPAATSTPPAGTPVSLEPPSLGGGSTPAPGDAVAATASPVSAGGSQLVSFGRFKSKDPFRPQVDPTKLTAGENPAQVEAEAATAAAAGGSGSNPPPLTSTPQPSAPAARPTSAVISVNGVPEVVALDAEFPAAEPTFKLVALTAKTAKIAVAGGSYASGAPTVTLKRGQKLTLMNTSDGRRYELQWLPDSAAPTAAAAATPAATPATPAPTGS